MSVAGSTQWALDQTTSVSPPCFSTSPIRLPFSSLFPPMLGFLSHISMRQPGAVSCPRAAESALFPLEAAVRRGWGGGSLASLPLQPWLCALGMLPGAGPRSGHSQCGPDSFPSVLRPSICFPLGPLEPLSRPGVRVGYSKWVGSGKQHKTRSWGSLALIPTWTPVCCPTLSQRFPALPGHSVPAGQIQELD